MMKNGKGNLLKMNKFSCVFLAIVILTASLLSACDSINDITFEESEVQTSEVVTESEISETTSVTTTALDLSDMTTATEVEADITTVNYESYSRLVEAEMGVASGNISLSQRRDGYSDTGYLTGFDKSFENEVIVTFNLPTSQHYNITLRVASDNKMNNILLVDETEIGEFITSGSGNFEDIVYSNVYLTSGINTFSIKEVTGGIDFDYISVESSEDIQNIELSATEELINENATEKAKATMSYLVENFGTNILSGQYVTPGTNNELDLIYSVTGRYPAIRLGDLSFYTADTDYEIEEIEKAIDWSKKGGLVSYMWHWQAPVGEPSFYTGETDFDLSKAVTDIDISQLPLQEIEILYQNGDITEETFEIVRDIDRISQQLLVLQENDVAVLWRPLHEASGDWFWWGASGFESYNWLWNLLYDRQTYYHGLNNLIWVWNAQDIDWYVGDDKCDIISADIYSASQSHLNQVNIFVQYTEITQNKLIALSESSTAPFPDFSIRDNAVWSWFGVWYGEYIMASDGHYSEQYMTKEDLILIYSHENVMTLERLPDLRE